MSAGLNTLILIAAGAMAAAAAAPDTPFRQEVEKWRAKHEADYRREYVGLAGLFSLKAGVNAAGSGASNAIVLPKSAPARIGQFVVAGQRVDFKPEPGVKVTLKGQAVDRSIQLKNDEDKGGPDELEVAGLALWVHLSGPRPTIRLRDDHGEVARGFKGFLWFPIDEKYRVTGKFIKDAKPQDMQIPNQLGDEQTFKTEGTVEFTIDGQKVRLRAMTTRPNRLYFIFRDGTSGKETYETARFLYSDLRSDGTTVLDFNEAYNPPCAFNPFTTCPLPLPENRLKVRIPAGEQNYIGHKS